MCVNANSKENRSWNKNKKIYIFTCALYACAFYCFSCRTKISYQQFLTFLSSMNIVRSSLSQILFKIGALKWFTIFWINKSLQHRYFSVNIAKLSRIGFLQNFSGGCFYVILKVIYGTSISQTLFLKKCPCYGVLIIFLLNTFWKETSLDV